MGPYLTNGRSPSPDEPARFGPGAKVAVIGAGVSGICAAAYLISEGANVTVFERSGVTSGVWHYDPKTPATPEYPSEKPSAGDYVKSSPGQFLLTPTQVKAKSTNHHHPLETEDPDALKVAFSPPGPAYFGLRNNIPTSLLYTNLDAKKSDDDSQWNLRTITLLKGDSQPKITEQNWAFDAIVVATGHYSLPCIPDTPGLAKWKVHFGDAVIHTKQYRRPEQFTSKTVLVIGGGASAYDICREASETAKKVIHCTRGGNFDLPGSMFPESVEHVGGVEKFALEKNETTGSVNGHVLLNDGQTLDDIDSLVLATGHITSYPFLQQYRRDDVAIDKATRDILVTSEGNMVHNLHKDIFYTEDPSLSFIGVPYHNVTFSLFDFQAQALARALTGKSRLSSRDSMRQEYDERVAIKGRGRKFHSLAGDGEEIQYLKDLLDWANSSLVDDEIEPLIGPSKEWLDTHTDWKEKMKLLRAAKGANPKGLCARLSDLAKA
ncbi:hypothetical protein NW768_002650 [Fusarium equiseti]|uniref:FAD dependent oxidoreductase domain-containing protein n=1 Tax=Fusarium equiseti TaxID=61235 RepID=A0ABQ8RPV7_FUSEQ|nr:hypothetical protein NW768_002650 [Fusarium equiseti]